MADTCSLSALKPATGTRILVASPPISGWDVGQVISAALSQLLCIVWSLGLSLVNVTAQDFTGKALSGYKALGQWKSYLDEMLNDNYA